MVRLARDVLADRGIAAGRLGIEDAHLSLEMHQHLLAALPDATFVGVSGALHGLRSVLSPEELQLIRQADAIADLGQERLIAEVQPGRSTSDVTAIVRHAMIDAIARRHPEMPYHLHVGGGLGRGELSAGHSEWTTWAPHDLYVQGQLLETVVSVWLWGYWGNVERAIYLGDPPDDVRRCFAVMIEANEVAIAAIRPGVRLAEIDRLAKSVLARHGFTTRSGSGCGRGIVSYEANARELAMDVRLYSDVVLEPGMAFSLEPDLHVPGLGTFRHCNTIIVTAQGCEVDSRLPRGLIAI
jgi:Xaa-Pro aminopeptidase/Xaa-Pro dipeptidase